MVCFAFSNGALGKNAAARYGRVMSDDSQIPATAHPMPCFVLVRPQMGENIGAAARAMWNFGLNHMRLVAPRDGWPNERAVALASGAAGVVLDPALVVETTPEAIADCTHVFVTTARERGLTKPILSPEAAMAQARAIHAAGGKVALIFGPERAGLENDDIARADAIITVPVNPNFPSLNLAQSVLLCAYEWRRQTTEVVEMRMEFARSDFATAIEVEKLADHYEEKLDEMGYFFPETKAAGMKLVLRNLWGRLPLTRADVQLFHGILRQMQRWRDRP